jgi:hypothetical protein
MPASDKIHEPVRNALIKDGWTITDDPYRINIEGEFLYADLRAQKEFADQTLHVIVVEIKSFGERSLIYALEEALGQYRIYRKILARQQPDYRVYLALPQSAYERLLKRPTFRFLMDEQEFLLVVVDTDKEEVVSWIADNTIET